MAVTIEDIAAHLRAFRQIHGLPHLQRTAHPSAGTQRRIRRIMAQMGYEPNFDRTVRSIFQTIGIILPSSQRDVCKMPFIWRSSGHQAVLQPAPLCKHRHYRRGRCRSIGCHQGMVANTQADGSSCSPKRLSGGCLSAARSASRYRGQAAQSAYQTIYIDNDNALAGEEATDYLRDGHRHHRLFLGQQCHAVSAERNAAIRCLCLSCITARRDCVGSIP